MPGAGPPPPPPPPFIHLPTSCIFILSFSLLALSRHFYCFLPIFFLFLLSTSIEHKKAPRGPAGPPEARGPMHVPFVPLWQDRIPMLRGPRHMTGAGPPLPTSPSITAPPLLFDLLFLLLSSLPSPLSFCLLTLYSNFFSQSLFFAPFIHFFFHYINELHQGPRGAP